MNKNKTKLAFTLIELLVVISVMTILFSFGAPRFLRVSREAMFSNNVTRIKEMYLNTRAQALNSVPVTPPSASNTIDTNYDGSTPDTLPYNYVFQIIKGTTNMYISYADYSLSSTTYNSTNDVLLSTLTLPISNLSITFNGITNLMNSTNKLTTPNNNSIYTFNFNPYDGSRTFSHSLTSTTIKNLQMTLTNPKVCKQYILQIDSFTGNLSTQENIPSNC